MANAANSPFLKFRFSITDQGGNPLRFRGGELPDLIFAIPPSNMERSFKKLPTRETTKGGWVEYHGGDDLDMITVNGSVGMIFQQGVGLVNISQGRQSTPARKFLNDLMAVYRNNGNSYDRRGFIYSTGYVKLHFDRAIYSGLFESISYTETVDKPYDYSYNFSFIVEKTEISLARPIGNRYNFFSL